MAEHVWSEEQSSPMLCIGTARRQWLAQLSTEPAILFSIHCTYVGNIGS